MKYVPVAEFLKILFTDSKSKWPCHSWGTDFSPWRPRFNPNREVYVEQRDTGACFFLITPFPLTVIILPVSHTHL